MYMRMSMRMYICICIRIFIYIYKYIRINIGDMWPDIQFELGKRDQGLLHALLLFEMFPQQSRSKGTSAIVLAVSPAYISVLVLDYRSTTFPEILM